MASDANKIVTSPTFFLTNPTSFTMSDASVENDGMYFKPQPLSVKGALEPYITIAKGLCIACGYPQTASAMLMTVNSDRIEVSHTCEACAHRNVLITGTIGNMKCEPSSPPATM